MAKKEEHALERVGTKSLQANIMSRIDQMVTAGEVSFPKNYSVGNAVKSAFLMLQEVKDKQDRPVLESCSSASISNAILQTVILGLSPAKKQCYYIAYGQKLTMMPSYFGDVAIAKSVDKRIVDIFAIPIYKNDKFEMEIRHARRIVKTHEQGLDEIGEGTIRGAYCTVVYRAEPGAELQEYSDVMTWEQIKTAWGRGQTKGQSSAHKDQPEEMARRTVTKRTIKWFLNTSNDHELDIKMATYNKISDGDEICETDPGKDADIITIDATDVTDPESTEKRQDSGSTRTEKNEKTSSKIFSDNGPGY